MDIKAHFSQKLAPAKKISTDWSARSARFCNSVLVLAYIENDDSALVNTSCITLSIQNVEYYREVTLIPKVFPHQWVKSCLAFSVPLGSVKWVIDGILVHDITSDSLRQARDKASTDLTEKIMIGAVRFAAGWKLANNKVTSMNIFSSALSLNTMKDQTEHNPENCDSEGDYLSWEEMEWETHGDASIDIVNKEQPCKKEATLNSGRVEL